MSAKQLERLLRPRSIAFVGGKAAEEALRQCRALGFAGEVWPVNPRRETMDGVPCFPSIADLPAAPDAVFLATPAAPSVDLAGELAKAGAGGAVCYASGFAEADEEGAALQQALCRAAGAMPLIGPNCYGLLNLFDRAALWPDQHGCLPIERGRGVAIVTQSGNLGINFTMQQRALPLGYMIAIGNAADVDCADLVEALLEDSRVSAIGLHIEGLKSIARFSEAALAARRAGVPIVALKTGASERGALLTMSHTSSLAGADALYDALFDRLGIARVSDPATFIETLKLLHLAGPLTGKTFTSASCSGGEASLAADLAARYGLDTPDFPPAIQDELEGVLGPLVHVANPLDYHTHIWGDGPAQTACFAGMLGAGFDVSALLLDFPRPDRCSEADWGTTLDAFVAAHRARPAAPGQVRMVVSSLPENLPEGRARDLLANGIAPMMGLREAIEAASAAAGIARSWARPEPAPLIDPVALDPAMVRNRTEAEGKALLAAAGIRVPRGTIMTLEELERVCADPEAQLPVPFPLVLKAVGADLAHKTELGGVMLNLTSKEAVLAAARRMTSLSQTLLLEEMVGGTVAEMIVGLARDPQFGLYLTVGAGGIFVELLRQSELLLLPTDRASIDRALERLPLHRILAGYRGAAGADLGKLVETIEAVAAIAAREGERLFELEINPLLALPDAAVAVDALVRMKEPS